MHIPIDIATLISTAGLAY